MIVRSCHRNYWEEGRWSLAERKFASSYPVNRKCYFIFASLQNRTMWIEKLFNSFRVFEEKEDHQNVIESVFRDIPFTGTKLWILIFAILLASLGLNVNSTAVIIGAILISPLMGPIIGMGLGVGIHNFGMLRSSIFNFLFAIAVSLVASTAYFLVSPIKEGHSEILARTSPFSARLLCLPS